MSEVTFAKSYLATLDKRPIKLPADHVGDPRKYPNQSPFILPKQSHPFPKREGLTATQAAKAQTVTATLRPMRSGEIIALDDIPLDTTIHDLKTRYSQQTSLPLDKIKLLLNKKPTADLKTLKELGVNGSVEFSVMVMGGAGPTTPSATSIATEKNSVVDAPASATAPVDKMDIDSQGPAPLSEKAQAEAQPVSSAQTAQSILKTEEFWTDLKGFLAQRLRDQGEAEKLTVAFRESWSRR